MAHSLTQQVRSFVRVGDNDSAEHPGEFAQHGRDYMICVPLEVGSHDSCEPAACFAKVGSAALLQEQISCYVCSEIPICVPCIVCEATGKTIVNDWCCSCLNAENVTGMVGDSDFRDLTQKRYQSLSTSQEDHDGKDGDTREKYVAAQCTKEFILNFPCITLFTNFPTKINFCYPCEKPVEGHGRPGTPLMAYQCIFWLCEHPTKIFCPPCVGCVKPLQHCVYTCEDAPFNETFKLIMDGEPKCLYCVPNHVPSSPLQSALSMFMFPCMNMYNMWQIFMHKPLEIVDEATGETRHPLFHYGPCGGSEDEGEVDYEATKGKRTAAFVGFSALCCLVPLVGHAISRSMVQQTLFPSSKDVNNVLMHKNCLGNLCCDVLFPCCAVSQETYAIALAEQDYANLSTEWEERTCLGGGAKPMAAAGAAPAEMEMTKRNE